MDATGLAIGLPLGALAAVAALSGLPVVAVRWALLFWPAAGSVTVLTAWWVTRPASVTLAAARERRPH